MSREPPSLPPRLQTAKPDAAGAGRLVGAAEDDAGVMAAERQRVGLVAAGELEAQELRLLGPAQRHLDDVEAVALRLVSFEGDGVP